MKPEEEEKLTQWIDGNLDDDQVRDLLNAHPELADLKKSAADTGNLLRQELPLEEDLPYPDFFNHRIQQRLMEEKAETETPTVSLKEEAQYLPLFTRSRLFAGIAFAALAIGLIVHSIIGPNTADSGVRTEIVGTYTPNPQVVASSHFNAEAGATIIQLEGLEEIPADMEISGIFPRSYEPDAALAATTLRSRDTNEPLVVLENDHYGRPNIRLSRNNSL